MTKRDLLALAAVVAAVGAMILYRAVGVEPREWGSLCLDLSRAPVGCYPRAGLLWLQHWQLWGAAALVLGFWSFLRAPFVVRPLAVALGVMAVLNFNATWGMIGAALGAWSWAETVARQGRSQPAR
ncbi:hypothetical protein ACE7GA_08030 [Roseomonas sp. CCTCC AB2023176]|uniref:hypothetical protein n=1 Tax=Roseomonas sp. CCTCC AB2023176 TaxID=3342640 RepID=UPI0035DEBA62